MHVSYVSVSSTAASAKAGGRGIFSRVLTAHIAIPSSSRLRDDAGITAVANKAKYREKLITISGLAVLS